MTRLWESVSLEFIVMPRHESGARPRGGASIKKLEADTSIDQRIIVLLSFHDHNKHR